ncbi:hypothetical protein JTB14_011648 [Gonioctena quinquepunctata]|nr:hypothetical protein JTB14_011648 [Gonioctena quinquepunctata]
MFKVNPDINTDKIIVSRRPSENKHRDATYYRACPNCKQMFSKLSLRIHFNKCSDEKQGARGILLRSKQSHMYVHENASENLVKFVLAHCREDEVAEEIMYDDLCIKFGRLCEK